MFGRSSTPEEIARFFEELQAHCGLRGTRVFDYSVEDYDAFTFPWYIFIGNEQLEFSGHYGADMTQLAAEGKIVLLREYGEHELKTGEFYRKTYRLEDVGNWIFDEQATHLTKVGTD